MSVVTSAIALARSAIERWSTEAVVVGYPKTGNTWLRFMLGRYVQLSAGLPTLPLFDEIDLLGRRTRFPGFPRVTVTHEPLTWENQTAADLSARSVGGRFGDRRVVLLVRHPLDVLVSNWFQQRTRATPRYEGELTDFIEDDVFGIEKLLRFYELWEDNRSDAVLLYRYEWARADAGPQLRRVLEHFGVQPAEEAISEAVDFASFENMRSIEGSEAAPRYRSTGNDVFATGDLADPDARHVRRGVVGGYNDYLADADLQRYEHIVNRRMPPWYGYGGDR